MVWLFERGGERLRYEIRRGTSDAFEVALTFPGGETRTEQTVDAAELLDRCAAIARELQDDGWQPPLDISR